jgi:probable rRNA maturation factor
MRVDVRSTLRRMPCPEASIRAFLNRALRASGRRAGEVSVLVCGDARMRGLNRRYRGKDRTTDVLSFPAEGAQGGFLGDLVVSGPEARRQARQDGDSAERAVRRLLLHGLLHLLGYDHETDQGQMAALEARLRRRLAIAR